MVTAPQITIEPAAWDARIAAHLEPAMADDPLATVATLQGLVQTGAAVCYRVYRNGLEAGAVVVRGETCELGRECVIVAAGGYAKGAKLLREVLPGLEQLWGGADAFRIHTARPGMLRELARQGYDIAEIVMRKASHGRQIIQ